MPKLTKCIQIWSEISRFWPIFFLLIKKPIIVLKFCWKIQIVDFRPEKARQAFEQNFTLDIKSLGKMSSLGIESLDNFYLGIISLGVLTFNHKI